MSKGMHGGLSGKARKIHGKSRAERMYAQHLIADFLVSDDAAVAEDRVVPVKPMERDSADSRYAYEFVAEAQAEVARSAEAERFDEAMNAVPILGSPDTEPSAARPDLSPTPAAAAASPVLSPRDGAPPHQNAAPQNVEILHAVAAMRTAEQAQVKSQWTAKVQPKLFTMRPARKNRLPQLTWSGVATGLAIGAAVGATFLIALSLVL